MADGRVIGTAVRMRREGLDGAGRSLLLHASEKARLSHKGARDKVEILPRMFEEEFCQRPPPFSGGLHDLYDKPRTDPRGLAAQEYQDLAQFLPRMEAASMVQFPFSISYF